MTPLQSQLESFGRRGKKLSSGRLLRYREVLTLLGNPERLGDSAYAAELAERVVAELQDVIASIKSPIDRRIAQVVVAAAPEFHEKLVKERTAYVITHGQEFTEEQFKTRRGQVMADVAEALQARFHTDAATHDSLTPGAEGRAGHPVVAPVPSPSRGQRPGFQRPPGRGRPQFLRGRRLIAAGAVVSLGALAGAVTGYGLDWRQDPSTGQSNVALFAATFDDKDPRSLEGNPCADAPLSQPAYPAGPEVIGPDGAPVATIQLRTQYSCPVVWPRIVWGVGPSLDMEAIYQIPDGWTLQVLTIRPETGSVFRYPEPSSGAPVPYALGKMASTAQHCVKVEVYFTNGTERTSSAQTDCIRHNTAEGSTP
ncbi:hypothetical protein [Rhodococcus chondri]|uniref:Uncharacterized protein n=1 Tax=Rhodococcus chondri TaxID=3065941 RepID=A0ABU7JSG5_9NOCA|nr:hypothetical protein [Rhodococcus sp. CC-R104]MEE2032973.1 hypothetical protein [Rhodococcus sp. CC-R104]